MILILINYVTFWYERERWERREREGEREKGRREREGGERERERALKLPHDWWIFGVDLGLSLSLLSLSPLSHSHSPPESIWDFMSRSCFFFFFFFFEI
jgi:hypothetical protein